MDLLGVRCVGYSVTNERGVAVHAREHIGVSRLACFLAIAIFMCETAVSEGQIIINVPFGTYTESAIISVPTPPESFHGTDLFAPQVLSPPPIYRFIGDTGHVYRFDMTAATYGEGPECHARLTTEALEPSDGEYGTWTHTAATVTSFTDFDFVIYNKTGTDIEYIVPLIVKGTLHTVVTHNEVGTNPMFDTKVKATAYIGFYECPHDWQDPAIGWYDLALYHNHYGESLPPVSFESKPWLLSVPVRLGKEPGDRACFTVCSQAYVSGAATAYSVTDHPELSSWSKMSGLAIVDPYIYIDPAWEHADKFGIAFPDNVTPLTELSDDKVFADGFEIGFTLFWSSTVP